MICYTTSWDLTPGRRPGNSGSAGTRGPVTAKQPTSWRPTQACATRAGAVPALRRLRCGDDGLGVPRSWTRLSFWDQLERRRDTGRRLVVILDSANASHYHHPRCEHVAEIHFETKWANNWRNGSYFWINDASEAVGYATARAVCGGELPSDVA